MTGAKYTVESGNVQRESRGILPEGDCQIADADGFQGGLGGLLIGEKGSSPYRAVPIHSGPAAKAIEGWMRFWRTI